MVTPIFLKEKDQFVWKSAVKLNLGVFISARAFRRAVL